MSFLTLPQFVLLHTLLTASPSLAVAEIKVGDILGVITLGILLLTTGLRGRERRKRMDQKQQHLEDRVCSSEINIKKLEEAMIRHENDNKEAINAVFTRINQIADYIIKLKEK